MRLHHGLQARFPDPVDHLNHALVGRGLVGVRGNPVGGRALHVPGRNHRDRGAAQLGQHLDHVLDLRVRVTLRGVGGEVDPEQGAVDRQRDGLSVAQGGSRLTGGPGGGNWPRLAGGLIFRRVRALVGVENGGGQNPSCQTSNDENQGEQSEVETHATHPTTKGASAARKTGAGKLSSNKNASRLHGSRDRTRNSNRRTT